MGLSWLVGYFALAGLAILQASLVALQTWEHRRFARSRLRNLERCRPTGRVMVCAPFKGMDTALETNLRCLLTQDYDDYEVTFVVQSAWDPAWALIRRLMVEYPEVPSRLLVAGRARGCGQKIHNLRVATRDVPPEVEYLAFVDSDAQPRREWLRALIARVNSAKGGAATGYRWFLPCRSSLANHLLYSINCGVALLFGSTGPNFVWGGSWAIRREVFESIRLRKAWKGTLSDDLVASRVLYQNGLRVKFEPACVVASPLEGNLWQMFSFIRRQYIIGRFYMAAWWLGAIVFVTLPNVVLLASVAAVAWSLATGTPHILVPAGICAVLYGLKVYRGRIRQDLGRLYFPQYRQTLSGARRFDIWAGALAELVNWIGLIASIFGRQITWRGITYRLYRGGQMEIVRHENELIGLDIDGQEDQIESSATLKRPIPYREVG